MSALTGRERVLLKRKQERALQNQLAYGTISGHLNHPDRYSALSHQEIADIMLAKKAHGVLAENLGKLKNLHPDTMSALNKAGYRTHTASNADSFTGGLDESATLS